MTDERWDRLDELAAAATPGPWGSTIEREDPNDPDGTALVEIPSREPGRIRWSNAIYSDSAEADADFIAACDPITIRSLVAENKALREAHPGYHTNGWRTDCRDCALEDAGQFGHNLATYGGPSLGHSGEFADCPQKLCERVRAALHREAGT